MNQKKLKFWIVAAVLLFLFVLTAGLDGLAFRPPPPLVGGGGGGLATPNLLIQLALFFLILLMLAILIFMPAEVWRHYKTAAVILGALLLAVVGVMRLAALEEIRFLNPEPIPHLPEEEGGEAVDEPLAPPPSAADPPPERPRPVWLIWLSNLLIGALLVGATAVAFNYIWHSDDQSESALADLVLEAEAALAEIRAGGATLDAIMRCYLEMGQILSENYEIEREEGMTPREFERRLVGLGLPGQPVDSLTRLFEAARYGRHAASAAERAEAVAALEAIVAACQELTTLPAAQR
jgi:hypothetical protein